MPHLPLDVAREAVNSAESLEASREAGERVEGFRGLGFRVWGLGFGV